MFDVMHLERKFQNLFRTSPRIYQAPGRVNLIGEHTDYNQGFVMPAALDLSCWVAAGSRPDRRLVIHSENQESENKFEAELTGSPLRPLGKWSDYPLGVAVKLAEAGVALPGANLLISGNVPLGAGLSSSAALEVAVGCALLDLAQTQMDGTQLALLCQRAENEFVGARCGIMDQFICCNGRAGHALMLDCRSLSPKFLPLPEDLRLIICDTRVKHAIAQGEYNRRRSECEEAVRRLAVVLAGIQSLRDVNLDQLEQHADRLTPALYRRARHVISENDRVLRAATALEMGRLELFGKLMAESHRSLRDDYEVSAPELDLMVDLANRHQGVWGARMTGGGFGGCTVNLVRAADAERFQREMEREYEAKTGQRPFIYASRTAPGAHRVDLAATCKR